LDAAVALVNALGARGIATIVDLHQDLLHPSLCGEGLPDHALNVTSRACNASALARIGHALGLCRSIDEFDLVRDPVTGYPTTESCKQHSFGLFYATPEVSSAFEALYTQPALQASMRGYWTRVATAFRGNPHVVGYELLNEPWAGDIWAAAANLEPGRADRRLLQPLYAQLHAAIRAVDAKTPIMFEGTQVRETLANEKLKATSRGLYN
jgi:endoglycosylceramidase